MIKSVVQPGLGIDRRRGPVIEAHVGGADRQAVERQSTAVVGLESGILGGSPPGDLAAKRGFEAEASGRDRPLQNAAMVHRHFEGLLGLEASDRGAGPAAQFQGPERRKTDRHLQRLGSESVAPTILKSNLKSRSRL